MTFRDYFRTINECVKDYYSTADFVVKFFGKADSKKAVQVETAKSWLSPAKNKEGSRLNFRVKQYFPGYVISKNGEKGVIRFFEKQLGNTWEKLRDNFSKIDHGVIDIHTDDKDVFFRSLLYQFLEIINVRLEDPDEESCHEEKTRLVSSEIETKDDSLLSVDNIKNGVNTHINNDTGNISHIAVEEKFRSCYYCIHWNGDLKDKYGHCKMFKKQHFFKDGKGCEEFEGNAARILRPARIDLLLP